jgi:hypothetical protein
MKRLEAKTAANATYPSIILSIKNTGQVEEGIIEDEFDLAFVGGHLISDEVVCLSPFNSSYSLPNYSRSNNYNI